MPNLFSNMLGVGENDVDEKLKYVGRYAYSFFSAYRCE
jgi:hypothetical protein